jgi:clan AA aspartic protease
MGFVHIDITLKNAFDAGNAKRGNIKESEIRQTTVTAMVDTGAATLVINEAIREELGLELENTYTARLADGTFHKYFYAEPVEILWKNRKTVLRPVVVPNANKILLGAIPLEDMDLIVNPVKQELAGAHGEEPVCIIYSCNK